MKIPQSIYWDVTDHCRDEAARHREACGVLTGPSGGHPQVTGWRALDNVSDHPEVRFEFDPAEQVEAWTVLDRQGLRPWVIYHSHLDTPAIMSDDDLARATGDLSMAHLIVSLSDGASRLWQVTKVFTAPTRVEDWTSSALATRELALEVVDAQVNPVSPKFL